MKLLHILAAALALASACAFSQTPAPFTIPNANITGGTATFTQQSGLAMTTPSFYLNDTANSQGTLMFFKRSGTNIWGFQTGPSNVWSLNRYNGGVYVDSPIQVNNSTGQVTLGTMNTTGLFAPASTVGILGTATNDNAPSGSWGEYGTKLTTGTALTTGVTATVASQALGAGDWDVQCDVALNTNASTVVSLLAIGLNTVAATLPAQNSGARTKLVINNFGGSGGGTTAEISTPLVRYSLAGTTTIYCVTNAGFTTSTASADGFIRWRRVR